MSFFLIMRSGELPCSHSPPQAPYHRSNSSVITLFFCSKKRLSSPRHPSFSCFRSFAFLFLVILSLIQAIYEGSGPQNAGRRPVWSTDSYTSAPDSFTLLQRDGNLVVKEGRWVRPILITISARALPFLVFILSWMCSYLSILWLYFFIPLDTLHCVFIHLFILSPCVVLPASPYRIYPLSLYLFLCLSLSLLL